MSIPKEPRQLMINLMYLVLTALLALNVSAEVMNAFFSLDRGLTSSRALVENTNGQLLSNIAKQAEAYNTPANQQYLQNAKEAQRIAQEFTAYIESIRTDVFNLGKGPSKKDPTIPKDIRNKDVTTRYFINENKGAEVEAKINETRQKLVALLGNDPEASSVEESLPLLIEALPPGTTAKNWAEFKFKQMPVAAIFPILGKMQSDAKNSATVILNHIVKKVSGDDIKFDKFTPAVSAEKSYVIQGEKYVADVFLSAYSSSADNININVNGSNLPIKEGIAHYETSTSGVGERSYKVNISVRNPLTNKTDVYTKEFKYEVGQRSVAVSLDKMNVFYIGVDNPISVSAAGVSSNDVRVSATGVTVNSQGGGKFNVRATTPGEASLTVSGGGASQTFKYRVKRIPDPAPRLGKYKGGQLGNGEFKAQGGISAVLENFDFDAKCDMVGFEFTYYPKRQDPIVVSNNGARWSGQAQDMVNKAKPGDAYFFDDIKCKCPGDVAARNIGSIAIKIR